MVQTLIAGANAPLPTATLHIRITTPQPVDCAAYRLNASQQVRGDGDMIFYGQTQSDDASVHYSGNETDALFVVNLANQPTQIDKIALTFSSDRPANQLTGTRVLVSDATNQPLLECTLNNAGNEKALIVAECYRRQGAWKFRFVAQGFDGGLKALSEHFGVEIADDSQAQPPVIPAPAPTSPPNKPPVHQPTAQPSRINLSKIVLTKEQSSINLAKQDDFGKIAINLNWNRAPLSINQTTGLLSQLLGKTHAQGHIDLDLGAFVRLKNGKKTVIQALGNDFGALNQAPYVRLRADDRTGQLAEGEWLDINGKHWQDIQEVLIYAFIYAGVPNWSKTDGVVTIHVPNQPPIETHLSEGHNQPSLCAIARLVNEGGSLKVERINRYFAGQSQLDDAFGWGFGWQRGRK